jgi:hypothetical protein
MLTLSLIISRHSEGWKLGNKSELTSTENLV